MSNGILPELLLIILQQISNWLKVPGTGIEPAHPCERQILSLLRLPIPPSGQNSTIQPPTFNLQPSTFNFQPSTFNLQLSTFNLQPSTIQPSTFLAGNITHSLQ